jgi:hypothetical protein
MRTHPNDRSFKPCLEQLEAREVPQAAIFQGLAAIQSQLLPVVQNLNNDLNSAINNFKTDFATLQAQVATTSTAPFNSTSAITATLQSLNSDWQRVLTDQSAIKSTVTADINFLNIGSFAYAQDTGNFNVFLFNVLFVDPQFQNILNTANNTVSSQSANANSSIPIPNVTVQGEFGETSFPAISTYTSPPRT